LGEIKALKITALNKLFAIQNTFQYTNKYADPQSFTVSYKYLSGVTWVWKLYNAKFHHTFF